MKRIYSAAILVFLFLSRVYLYDCAGIQNGLLALGVNCFKARDRDLKVELNVMWLLCGLALAQGGQPFVVCNFKSVGEQIVLILI